jgi:hypothetical protein
MKTTLFISLLLILSNALFAQEKEFKPSGNLWGYGFGDYYYITHADSLGRGAGSVQYKPYSTTSTLNGSNSSGEKTNLLGSGSTNSSKSNAFQVRRFYLGYDYNFAPKFSATVVLANEQNLDAGGNNTFYLKYANLKWSNIFPKSNLFIGQQPTLSFATPFGTEPLWGYRSVEKTIMDIHGNDSSTDLGVSLQGTLKELASGDSLKPNLIEYGLQIGNGNASKPENDRYKIFRYTFYTSLMQQRLTLGLYGDFRTIASGALDQSAQTYKVYANYNAGKFRIGGEIFTQTFLNGSKLSNGTYENTNIFGWEVFVSGKILPKLNYYAMYDRYNPNTNYKKDNTYTSVPSLIIPQYTPSGAVFTMSSGTVNQASIFSTQDFVTAGLDWTPVNRVHIMPNIWYTQFNSMVNLSESAQKARRDYTLVPRITFYFIFNSSPKVSNNGMDI